MAMVCTSVTEWIETNVSKPVEDWEDRQEKKCKKRHWYDPRSWFCWFITIVVKVIRWVVVTVVTAVVSVVCNLVGAVLSFFYRLFHGLWLLVKSLVTWDKCTLQEALGEFGNMLGGLLLQLGDMIVRPIFDYIQTYRLRNYVRHQIAQRYWMQPDVIPILEDLFNVNSGVFGWRLTCTVKRMFVDSQTMSSLYTGVPNLLGLHNDTNLDIDLYELAGFDQDCSVFDEKGWYRPRHQTATFPFATGGGGFGEPTPPELTRDQLTEYIKSDGAKGPHFRIYAISPGNLDTRIDAAKDKGKQLGLRLDFNREERQVTDPQFINYNRSAINPAVPEADVDCLHKNKGQADYLICELGRRPKSEFKCCDYGQQSRLLTGSPGESREDLCSPVAVAVFGFTDRTTRGLTSNLIGTTYAGDRNLHDSVASGLSFIDDIPDELRKYVLIHELGHYFGLCHVDGFDRIMVSGKEGQGSAWTWSAIPNTLLHGGPRFTHAEAKRVWDFILTNFPLSCFIPGEHEGPILL
jgi:hypothetical protein